MTTGKSINAGTRRDGGAQRVLGSGKMAPNIEVVGIETLPDLGTEVPRARARRPSEHPNPLRRCPEKLTASRRRRGGATNEATE